MFQKTGLLHAPTCGFGAPVFGLACYCYKHPQLNPPWPGCPIPHGTASEVALLPQLVDHELLEGTTVNFSRSLIRLAWLLQHAETILPGRRNPSRLLESATLMPGDSCCRPVHGSARSRTIRLSLSGTLDSADLSMAAGNLAVLRLVVSLTDPLASSSSSGTQMPRSMA